jgi:hypothetical protein
MLFSELGPYAESPAYWSYLRLYNDFPVGGSALCSIEKCNGLKWPIVVLMHQ